MFKKVLFIIIFIFTNHLFSQAIEVVSGLSRPVGIAINGEDIFICELADGGSSGMISKADLSVINPTKENLLTNQANPRAVCLVGEELYYATNNLFKLNINDSNPTGTQVIYTNSPRALIATDDDMFISGDDRISKINLNSTNPYLQLVVDNIEARILAFALKGDELYFGYSNKVSKINITDANPVVEEVISGFESNVYSLAFYEDTLIVGLALYYKLLTVDINASTLVAQEFIPFMNGQPMNIMVYNNDLYIAGGQGNNILKVENLEALLGIEEIKSNLNLKIYPNPTSDYIQISGLLKSIPYEIYKTNGVLVIDGVLEPKSRIDLRNLSSGIYYINLKDGLEKETCIKVIKH
ncbi:T9SS type A sorting domain-containing protein [Bizionia arctica]|uniref:Secretion system C-terminal sorting domain-containing protein n=1 Tax=Bizionia arctica TaxID=1495645 RepID=A0A917GGT8_9FLAO|nr:T9SS type A sorting domain-containing protein [Bizionia arctica]GGG45462.1 hypothetical protein GCM10010976_16360 [Bizionia arctica]